MIPQEFLQDMLNRLDIVEVIGRYIPLKRSGQNFSACCPFHQEKTPSFSVSPSKQFYHCFGCGAHGNALSFIMEHSGLPFVEAVQQLAQQVGLEVPQQDRRSPQEQHIEREKYHASYALLDSVSRFYQDRLTSHALGKAYVQQRGINAESIEVFQIGYAAGHSPHTLIDHFTSHLPLLQEQGLCLISERSQKPYDRFRDRIIFPIHDAQGRCVGFGGRALGSEQTPKYLNSPETPLFNKSHLLYGLHLARPHFKTGHAIIVEGYLDVIMLHQYGFKNAVATLGTAINAEHLKKLLRHTDTLIFCFDGDTAGQKAAQKALDYSLGIIEDGQTIRFLFLPDNHDPDSFLRQQGAAAFQQQLEQAKPLSEVWVQRWVDQHPPTHAEARAALWKGAKNDLNTLTQAPLLSKFLREDLYDKIGQFNKPETAQFSTKTSYPRSSGMNSQTKFSGRAGYKSNEFNPTEATLSIPRPRPSLWRVALDLALFAPHLRAALPKPEPQHSEIEAQAVQALLNITDICNLTPQEIRQHPQLKIYQTLIDSSLSRIDLWPKDFDIEAELMGLKETLRLAKEKQQRMTSYLTPNKNP